MGDSAKVVSLADERLARQPHLTGDAKCLSCGHEWVAVAPVGSYEFECPECKAVRGVWDGFISVPPNRMWYVCNNCDCPHFTFQTRGPEDSILIAVCVGCGAHHKPWLAADIRA